MMPYLSIDMVIPVALHTGIIIRKLCKIFFFECLKLRLLRLTIALHEIMPSETAEGFGK